MPRLLTLALAIVAATPVLAAADECLVSSPGLAGGVAVGGMSGISVGDPLVAVFGIESVDFELEMRLGLRKPPPRGDELGMNDEAGMLWCLSPDDPRCSPIDGPTQSPPLSEPMPATLSPGTQTPDDDLADTTGWRRSVDDVRADGELARVERPPRR